MYYPDGGEANGKFLEHGRGSGQLSRNSHGKKRNEKSNHTNTNHNSLDEYDNDTCRNNRNKNDCKGTNKQRTDVFCIPRYTLSSRGLNPKALGP